MKAALTMRPCCREGNARKQFAPSLGKPEGLRKSPGLSFSLDETELFYYSIPCRNGICSPVAQSAERVAVNH